MAEASPKPAAPSQTFPRRLRLAHAREFDAVRRSGIRRLLGSVTDRVVRNSWDPVLIMPPSLALAETAGRKLDGIKNSLAEAAGPGRLTL